MVTLRETVCLLWHVHDVFKYMGDCSVCLLSDVADNDVFKYMGDCSVCLLSNVADNDVSKYVEDSVSTLCCGIFIESCTFCFSLLVWWHVLVAEELTVDRVYSQNSSDALVRQALSQPWIPSDMTHVPFTQTQPPADYFEVKNNNSGTNL